jgi:hypothetical protein
MFQEIIPSPLVLEKYRFLDVLDSTRFNYDERQAQMPFRLLMAKVEVLAALIAGDGISVSENLLMDSAGFLNVFSELCEIATRKNLSLPLRVAVRGTPDDIYCVAASLFAKAKDDKEKRKKRFKLSAWTNLDGDEVRRLDWARFLEEENRIPQEFVYKGDDGEQLLVDQLMKILTYTNSNLYHTSRIVQSRDSKHVFINEMAQIASLSEDKIDTMLRQQQVLNSPIVQPPWITNKERDAAIKIAMFLKDLSKKHENILDNRTVIHDAVDEMRDINLKKGIIEITDSIYNYALGYATYSSLSGDTVHHIDDYKNPFVLAGNSLSRWSMETYWSSRGGYDIQIPWGLYASGLVGWTEKLTDKRILALMNDIPWEACLNAFLEPEWQDSLAEYKYALSRVQTIDRIRSSGVDVLTESSIWKQRRVDAENKLQEDWYRHLSVCKKLISNAVWKFRDYDSIIDLGGFDDLICFILGPDTKCTPNRFKKALTVLLKQADKLKIYNNVSTVVSQLEDIAKPKAIDFRTRK